MKSESEAYTGFLKFRSIDFSFVFSNDKLRLIPPVDKAREIKFGWLMKEIKKGVYTKGEPLRVEEESITGTCNETKNSIIFLPKVGSIITCDDILCINGSPMLYIEISAFILCRFSRDKISRISFAGPEINYIHPVNQALSWLYDSQEAERGVYKIETNDFSETTSKEQSFVVDEKTVKSKFGISRSISTRIDEVPLSLNSTLLFDFDPTNDYSFILRLWKIAKDYVSFLCYRRNVIFDEIELSAPYNDDKHELFASMFIVGCEKEPEKKALKECRCIKQNHVEEGEAGILQDIADNTIYVRHLPASYKAGRHIDASRFVMITAAFEWEFKQLHPNGLPKTKCHQAAEESVHSEINSLINSRTGTERKIYKFLGKLIGATSLQDEIVSVCKEFDSVVGSFGKHLYSINNEKLKYSDMGKRLSEQRNHFAHGDIDKDFIGLSILDLIFLEYIIYAIQLKRHGINDESIKKAINELFHLNFAI